MPHDEQLAERVRSALAGRDGLSEKSMFGGIAFLLQGNMCCGVHGGELIVRLGAEGAEAALEDQHTRPMDLTGRPMNGWVMVAPAALEADKDLRRWTEQAADFAASLPPK